MFNNDADYARSKITASFMRGNQVGSGLYKITDIVNRKNNDLSKATILSIDEEGEEKSLSISDLSFSVGKLGYVTDRYTGAAFYLSRMPIRRDFKQGLRSSQLCFVRNGSSNGLPDHWLENNVKSVSNCLRDKYLDFNTVLELSEETNSDTPLSKNFALSNKYKLLYRGFSVGSLNKKDKFSLSTQFNFLEEELVKELGNDKLSR
jgi:hypothetical protein